MELQSVRAEMSGDVPTTVICKKTGNAHIKHGEVSVDSHRPVTNHIRCSYQTPMSHHQWRTKPEVCTKQHASAFSNDEKLPSTTTDLFLFALSYLETPMAP